MADTTIVTKQIMPVPVGAVYIDLYKSYNEIDYSYDLQVDATTGQTSVTFTATCGYYYKFAFEDGVGTISALSEDSFYVPPMDFCTLSELKRVTSTQGGKIRYSESFKALTFSPSTATVRLNSILFSDEYSGIGRYTFEFTDSTSFTLTEYTSGFKGSGDINSTFISNDGNITIDSSNWSGSPTDGDLVRFETDSNMSNYSGQKCIEYAETLLYGEILALSILKTKATIKAFLQEDEIRFGLAMVYVLHKAAWKAYYDCYPETSTTIKDKEAPAVHWDTIAKEALKNIIFNVKNNTSCTSRPEWVASAILIKERGVSGVGEGIISVDNITKNVAYSR